ncbi:heterotrimeric GTP-binding alpha subunit [Pholiota conissans]|uniref:Heterotrimeric GTP-binding alpha subunit n=1 Tax=Pholiota conissans TaxID=109636 RepID=A0A9P5ZBU9_9AGAR|nr:heterotrimeric GTP-binding alpha subunit [Pholiota conissans]
MSKTKTAARGKERIDDRAELNPFEIAQWSGETSEETEEEARLRVQALQQAVQHSRRLDQYLLEGKKELDRRRKAVKILLLGQSESGKLVFAPNHFESERTVWRTIIQLNVIGTIKTILDALQEELEPEGVYPTTPLSAIPGSPLATLRRLRFSISPLFFIESNLLKIIAPECTDSRDMSVRAGTPWKSALRAKVDTLSNAEKARERRKSPPPLVGSGSTSSSEHDPTNILVAQRGDIISTWKSPEIQDILQRRRSRLRHSAGFFMDDIERITTLDYVPSDYDILRARIRTIGVEEYQFKIETGPDANIEYFITDVGGTRHQRASWAPFFDDVQVILFLAPLAFNQMLDEDARINRLEDSMFLWKDICENKLLAHANLILFLNKRDVLAATLKSGVQVKKYVPTYGDFPNDVATVTKYFKDKFRAYHKKYSPEPRAFFCYETSAIDIKSMSVLLSGVRESILRQDLKSGDLI